MIAPLRFIKQDENGEWSYSAGDVIDYLKSAWQESEAQNELKGAVFDKAKVDATDAKN